MDMGAISWVMIAYSSNCLISLNCGGWQYNKRNFTLLYYYCCDDQSIMFPNICTWRTPLQVVGQGHRVGMEHRQDLGLIESFLHEVQRHCCFMCLSFPHTCSKDNGTFRGYSLPKDAVIYANFYAAHMDPSKWLFFCSKCPSCPPNACHMGWATSAIWAIIKKYCLCCNYLCLQVRFSWCVFILYWKR